MSIVAKTIASRSNVIAMSIVLAVALAPTVGLAAANSSISGKWAGKGTVRLQSGKTEHVSCRVAYGRIAGQNFSLQARCATSGGRIDQAGELTRVRPNRYVGSVQNKQFNVSATIKIHVSNNKQVVIISSSEGKARIRLSRR